MELWIAKGEDGRQMAHRLLQAGCRELLGWEKLPELGRRPGGKPYFVEAENVCFSLSHSGPYGLCGLSRRGQVGVDVEVIRPRRPALPQWALSREEYRWYLERGAQWGDFYTLWTLKEAAVKCSGAGLSLPPRAIGVPLLSPGEAGAREGLSFAAYGGDGWRAACCGEEPAKGLKWFCFS